MPGRESLRAGEYYAHPHNAFWRILGSILGLARGLPYPERVARLRASGVALWDVLQSCTRRSSLDSDIVETSIIPNDFAAFFAAHPDIRFVFFNGSKAQAFFERHVRSSLPASLSHLIYERLPSTSPANASISFERKLRAWQKLKQPLRASPGDVGYPRHKSTELSAARGA